MDFADRHVVVTGGTGALGAAVVGQLLAAGATVHVPNSQPDELIRYPHKKHARLDIVEGVDLTFQGAVDSFYVALPRLWASIHLAGGFAMAPIAESGLGDYHAILNTNLMTCFLCCRAALGNIRGVATGRADALAGANRSKDKTMGKGKKAADAATAGGRIVNVAARPAIEPRSGAGMTLYTASKAAVAAFTQALAEEVAGESIYVNAVAPSILDTPANRAAMPQADFAAWPKVGEVAQTIVFLASPANQATRGAVVPVYGRA